MEGQATSPGASTATPATLSDLGRTSGHVGDSMPLDYTEQLLTPENSRSETSSNNENAPNDEKPTLRRSSSRVTRASLQRTTQPDTPEADNREGLLSPDVGKRNVTGQPPVNGLTNKKKSQSSLRHSLAVMESSQWNESALTRDPDAEDHLKEPDTPISNSSQEPQPTDMATSLQQRTLRKRVESALVKQETEGKGKPKTPRPINKDEPLRRSSRLSVVGRASALVDRAGSVLGKRSRDMMEMSKEVGRRAGLRPRNILKPKEDPIATGEIPATKRRRASAGDAPSVPKEKESTNQPVTPVRYKPKRWLSHGLYIGQEPVDGPPCQNRNKTTKRRRTIQQQRKYLPMPMFAGARLLSNGRDFKLPFDIFSPLPPGQPKPDEWRKTNKNVFVGEAGNIWRANKRLELSKCLCTEDAGCDENCQNRYMFYECDDSNCGLGRECGNRSFEELKQRSKAGGKYNVGVEVIKTGDRGYGVRSNRTFEPNQIIVEYTGEIITQTECEKRMRTTYKNNECYYLMYFDQNMIIDATRGSIARFVNHSCEPNCRMEKWTVAGKPRMALFAGDRGIMTGEELSYDYNFDPYSQKNVQECRCGSENCRGVLGPRPREKERAKELRTDNQKKSSPGSNASAGVKRKNGHGNPASRLSKRSRLPGPQAIRSGIKNAVSKARSTVSRSTASSRAATEAKTTARATAKKASVRVKATTRARAPTPARSRSNKLSRPSAETKKRILTKSTPRSRSTKEKDEPQPVRKRNNQYTVRRRNNQYTKGTVKPKNPTAKSARARK